LVSSGAELLQNLVTPLIPKSVVEKSEGVANAAKQQANQAIAAGQAAGVIPNAQQSTPAGSAGDTTDSAGPAKDSGYKDAERKTLNRFIQTQGQKCRSANPPNGEQTIGPTGRSGAAATPSTTTICARNAAFSASSATPRPPRTRSSDCTRCSIAARRQPASSRSMVSISTPIENLASSPTTSRRSRS